MELKGLNKLKLLNKEFGSTEEFIIKQREETQSQFNQNEIIQLLTPQDLEIKRSAILSRTNNQPDIEQDFRNTYALFESQKSDSNSQLNEAYQKYIRDYHKITSLYLIYWCYSKNPFLHIFDTEKETSKIIKLKVPESSANNACLTVLPYGRLFCFGDGIQSGFTCILNSDYEVQVLPIGESCSASSAIYFNKNVYCFGGVKSSFYLNLSRKFDLNKNKWVKLTPMPIYDYWCSSVIFNGNILISGYESKNILLYSIDIDSFSTISYDFALYAKKLLVYAERLYLIECKPNGLIYENEVGNEYSWKQIASSITISTPLAYGLYNKGRIYIIAFSHEISYYKFHLDKKEMHKIRDTFYI